MDISNRDNFYFALDSFKDEMQDLLDEFSKAEYDRGYSEGLKDESWNVGAAFNNGLKQAWEYARKIGNMNLLSLEEVGFTYQDKDKNPSWDIVMNYSVSDVIAMLDLYKAHGLKVGSKVRTLKETSSTSDTKLFPVGTIGTITRILPDSDLQYVVEADGDFWYYSADMLEVVNTDFQVGDEVKLQTCSYTSFATVCRVDCDSDGQRLYLMFSDGSTKSVKADSGWVKTGKHYSQIADILTSMKANKS